jgi:predicted transcriptional regulator
MSTQITVRIPDDLARFVDEAATAENASGRAAIVTRALARERRRLAAERDAAIYAGRVDDPELDAVSEYAARQLLDID